MQRPFDPLWERLLRGGVDRRHARRYVAELQDHLDDLIAEERRTADASADARTRALARLGSADALAEAMIAQRPFRAWSAKAPVATYLIAPTMALALGAIIAVAGVVILCTWLRSARGGPSELPPWTRSVADSAVLFSNALLPILLASGLSVMAFRQRASPVLPTVGIVVLAAAGAAVQVGVTLPSAGARGEIEILPSLGPSLAQAAGYLGRLAVTLALTLVPYAGFSLWRARRADLNDARRWGSA